MHYENGIKDEKNIWKNLSLTWHNQGLKEGLQQGRMEERKSLLALIAKMGAGGDADKIATLDDPEVMNAMQKKYGIR